MLRRGRIFELDEPSGNIFSDFVSLEEMLISCQGCIWPGWSQASDTFYKLPWCPQGWEALSKPKVRPLALGAGLTLPPPALLAAH